MIYPRCHPYWIIDGEKVPNTEYKRTGHRLAYTSMDYILPCCWCDTVSSKPDMERFNLLSENLKVENNDSIEDIISSDEWVMFHEGLLEFPDLAPRVCKSKCSKNPLDNAKVQQISYEEIKIKNV